MSTVNSKPSPYTLGSWQIFCENIFVPTCWARPRFAAQCDFSMFEGEDDFLINSSFQGLMSQGSGVRNCRSRF